ncbi:hypothetical protein ACIPJG_32730 [Streptomyces halstedii]|uniref:hypothetical protein n=1 Tax=Streptomyces halstedii TaxID=1944 RepID=UPI0037F65E38
MARMLNAHAARWQHATATYGYEVKGNLRAREERAWRRDWSADDLDAEDERHTLEWMRLRASGRRMLALIEATEGSLAVWHR